MRLKVYSETWPLAATFAISRGSRTEAEVVVVELSDGAACGWAECFPYARYGETIASVLAQIEAMRDAVEDGLDRQDLSTLMPAGAARNALDCALWDLTAKKTGRPVWSASGLTIPDSAITAYTLSLASPAEMEQAALAQRHRPLLKIKVGAGDDIFAGRGGSPRGARGTPDR